MQKSTQKLTHPPDPAALIQSDTQQTAPWKQPYTYNTNRSSEHLPTIYTYIICL